MGFFPSEPSREEPERLSTPFALLTFRRSTRPDARSADLLRRTMARLQRFQRALRRKPTHVAFRALLPSEVRNIAAVV